MMWRQQLIKVYYSFILYIIDFNNKKLVERQATELSA